MMEYQILDTPVDGLAASIDRLEELLATLNPDTDSRHDAVSEALRDLRKAHTLAENARSTLAVENL